jgi:hypothetical protein
MPHRLKGLGDTAQIAHAIIDDCNHIYVPEAWENTPSLLSLFPQAMYPSTA